MVDYRSKAFDFRRKIDEACSFSRIIEAYSRELSASE
jgi:hypothetical protein